MYVYFLLFMHLLLFAMLTRSKENNKITTQSAHKRIFYVLIPGFSIWVVMALRSDMVGTDILNYSLEFYNSNFYLDYKIRKSEMGYSYFNNFFNILGFGYQQYIALIAGIFIIAISYFYYNYSRYIVLSFYLHITIGLFSISMSGLRQTIAIGLSIIAFTFLEKNKIFLYFLAIGVAYLFHNSALVFLLLYFFRKVKITKKNGLLFLTACLLIFNFKGTIAKVIQNVSPEKYLKYIENVANVNNLVIIVMIAIPVICLIFWPKNIDEDEKYHRNMSMFFVMSCINFVVYFLATEIPLFERLSLYFIIFNTVLIPNIVSDIANRNIRTLALLMCIVLPMIQFLISTPGGSYGIDNYKFFWERY